MHSMMRATLSMRCSSAKLVVSRTLCANRLVLSAPSAGTSAMGNPTTPPPSERRETHELAARIVERSARSVVITLLCKSIGMTEAEFWRLVAKDIEEP